MKAFFDLIQDFLYQGGPVLSLIFAVVFLMWIFILERFFYFKFKYPLVLKKSIKLWSKRSEKHTFTARKIRELEISKLSQGLSKNISLIKTLVLVCPLFGLLGTVTGMISVFEVMAEVGTGNARLMASGISMATIPTMAGLVSSLTGLYFGNILEHRFEKEKQKASEELSFS